VKYVVDRRPQYEVNWAITNANAGDLEHVSQLATLLALRSGETYYIHRLSESRGRWVCLLKIAPVGS
jgi:hypothetical protein